MRSCHNTRMVEHCPNRGVRFRRLLGDNVKSGPTDMPGLKGRKQRSLVDQTAARAIDDARTALHASKLGLADEALRLGCERGMQRDKVRLLEKFSQRDEFHAETFRSRLADHRV